MTINTTRLLRRVVSHAMQQQRSHSIATLTARQQFLPSFTQAGTALDNNSKRGFAQASAASTTTNDATATTSSTAAATTSDRYAELVKDTIKKMISERTTAADDERKPISDDDLKAKFSYYKNVFEEAKLCIKDLQEATPADECYADECACAQGAVENAFTAYVDLLEDLRRANEEQLDSYREVRNAHAFNLKSLRQELDEVLSVPPPSKVA